MTFEGSMDHGNITKPHYHTARYLENHFGKNCFLRTSQLDRMRILSWLLCPSDSYYASNQDSIFPDVTGCSSTTSVQHRSCTDHRACLERYFVEKYFNDHIQPLPLGALTMRWGHEGVTNDLCECVTLCPR